jgi:hypothetical protein
MMATFGSGSMEPNENFQNTGANAHQERVGQGE